jgi:hypothetical protein
MLRYWEEAKIVGEALRAQGHDYWAKRLERATEAACTGGELAQSYFGLLVEILDLQSVSGDARDKAQGLFSRLSKDLYHDEVTARHSADHVRSYVKARREPYSKE